MIGWTAKKEAFLINVGLDIFKVVTNVWDLCQIVILALVAELVQNLPDIRTNSPHLVSVTNRSLSLSPSKPRWTTVRFAGFSIGLYSCQLIKLQ